MKRVEDLPLIGYISVVVYFDGYKDSFQNDTRRKLDGSSDKIKGLNQYIEEKTGFEFEPDTFSLLKKVVGKQSRSYGATHSYRYQVDSTEDLVKVVGTIKDWFEQSKFSWWRRFELEYCELVGGE